jgi:hypothetical protein
MFENAFKRIDYVPWKDVGHSSELDYTEQSSWLHFLKYLDGLARECAIAAELKFKPYTPFLKPEFQWAKSAAPKTKQKMTVEKKNAATQHTNRLKSFYQQKLTALDALKKSLRHQAFAGQLDLSSPSTRSENVSKKREIFDTLPA